jgi:hypothetical protein
VSRSTSTGSIRSQIRWEQTLKNMGGPSPDGTRHSTGSCDGKAAVGGDRSAWKTGGAAEPLARVLCKGADSPWPGRPGSLRISQQSFPSARQPRPSSGCGQEHVARARPSMGQRCGVPVAPAEEARKASVTNIDATRVDTISFRVGVPATRSIWGFDARSPPSIRS